MIVPLLLQSKILLLRNKHCVLIEANAAGRRVDKGEFKNFDQFFRHKRKSCLKYTDLQIYVLTVMCSVV